MMPIVIAHRGASGYAPENTAASIRKALETGVDAIEFDVQLTRDNHFVLFHDYTIKRITGRRGYVADSTLEQLKQLDVGTWFGKKFAGERIITLPEAFTIIRNRCQIIIDVKHKGSEYNTVCRLLMQKIKTSRFKKQIFIHSQEHGIEPCLAQQIMQHGLKNIKLGYIHYHYGDPFKKMMGVKYNFISPIFWLTSKKLVKRAHKEGLMVFPWVSAKERILNKLMLQIMNKQMKKLIRWGVDGIFTNCPDKLQDVINALNKSSEKQG